MALPIASSEEDLAEGGPEVGVEDGVDDGVEKTIDVAEPDNDAGQYVRISGHGVTADRISGHDVAADQISGHGVAAERLHERDDEEWKPAHDEGSGHDSQRSGRFSLSLLLLLFASSHRRRQQ